MKKLAIIGVLVIVVGSCIVGCGIGVKSLFHKKGNEVTEATGIETIYVEPIQVEEILVERIEVEKIA